MLPFAIQLLPPNGMRYPQVGGTRERHFDGTNFQPRNLPENAATPTRRVHAVLGVFSWWLIPSFLIVLRSKACPFSPTQLSLHSRDCQQGNT